MQHSLIIGAYSVAAVNYNRIFFIKYATDNCQTIFSALSLFKGTENGPIFWEITFRLDLTKSSFHNLE
jgi:hypothetical protein